MGAMAPQITSLTIVYSIVYSGTVKKNTKLCVTGLCVENSSVTGEFPAQMGSNGKMFSFDDVIMPRALAEGCEDYQPDGGAYNAWGPSDAYTSSKSGHHLFR